MRKEYPMSCSFSRLFFAWASLFASPIVLCAQCEFDVCGYWYSENYNSGVPVEYLAIDLIDDKLVCTKVLGDPYVPTGHVTWQGVPVSCVFAGQIFATSGIGQPIIPFNCTISILSADHIFVTPFNLHFYRSTTAHLEFVGVDYSTFPVSCIECGSPFPNVFTPNADGVNDLMELACGGRSARFAIMDRWGVTMYETTDEQPTWDGRNEWSPCPEGVYFWSMILLDNRTGSIRRGVVHLLR